MKQTYFTLFFCVLVLSGCASNTPSIGSSEILDSPFASGEASMGDTIQLTEDLRYVAFSPDVFEQTQDRRRVLFFFASWCPTCIPADEEFNQRTGELPDDVSLIRVNYNDPDTDQAEKDLAQTYAVTYQHTFVQIDTDGNEIARWTGGGTEQLLDRLR